ncbi:reverse transcriptase domain-containing protein [Tanacetum coccineum]
MVISSALSTIEKANLLEVLRNHKGAIAWSIADIKGIDSSFCTHKILMEDEFKPSVQPQRRLNPNIKEVVKKDVIKLLDAGLIYPISDSPWVSPVQVVPKKEGMTVVKNKKDDLIPQWTVTGWREGIVLGHKVSGSGIEVDKAKIKAISKLPYPTNVKAIRSFLGHAESIQAFDKLKRELTQAPIMIKPDLSLPFKIMCDASDYAVGAVLGQRIDKHFKPIHYASKTMNEAQENYTTTEKELLAILIRWILLIQEFEIDIHDKKCAKNLAADHLSRLENPDLGKLTKAEIRDLFPKERLMVISDKNNEPWYADYANYLASRELPFQSTRQEKQKFFSDLRHYFWDDPFLFKSVLTESYEDAWPEMRQHKFLDNVTADHLEDIMALPPPQEKPLRLGFTGHISSEMHVSWYRNKYILVAIDYVSKWVEAQAFPTNDTQNVVNFLKRLFARFGIPKALISDREFKTLLGTNPFRIIYDKECHLPVELEHKAYWAIKNCNLDLTKAGENRFLQINKLDEIRLDAYETSISYKERAKRWHDKWIKALSNYQKGDKVTFDEKKLGSS